MLVAGWLTGGFHGNNKLLHVHYKAVYKYNSSPVATGFF